MTDTEHSPPYIFTALDLELNQNKATGPRIIQIGAVVGDLITGVVLEKLSVFVNPYQELEPYIKQLTKITQEQVDTGVSIIDAAHQLVQLHTKYKSFCNPIVWGQGDVKALTKETPNVNLYFGRRELDTKTLYVSWRLANSQHPTGGLSKAMSKVGLQFQGQAHNATWDALNTFLMYRRMLDFFKIRAT